MNICLFTQEEINKPLSLSDERGNHLIKILHKKEGDSFTAGIIGDKAGTATITKIDDKEISFSFKPESSGKELFPVKMIIGFPRPIQLKRLLRDVAALGVSEVHLTGTELGEKSYMQSTLVERGAAYKMLLDGTVQAGSTHVPELFLHQTLKECIEAVESSSEKKLRLCLDNVNPVCTLVQGINDTPCAACNEICNEENSIIAAIGSERGWTEKERKMLEAAGYIRCGMGERIMRTETAATVAGAIILAQKNWL